MDHSQPVVALFAKFPRPGEVKTRLVPTLGEEGAAALHKRLVERTIATVRESGLPFAVWTTGADAAAFGRWLGEDVATVGQGKGDLGARLGRVPAPAILLGADVPDLTRGHLIQAAAALKEKPVVIGPARDGGYYLLGFTAELPFLWQAMPWGTDAVLRETETRLKAAEVRYRLLETLDDCDRPADLENWPEFLP